MIISIVWINLKLWYVLAHLSWKLVSFSDRLSSVCPSINFSPFRHILQNHLTNFNHIWQKSILGWRWFKHFQMRGYSLLQGELIIQFIQFHLNFAQGILFGEGDSSLFKWRPCPFHRGDKYEIAKIPWRNFELVSSRITGPISTKFCAKHRLWMGFKFVKMKGHALFQREIIMKKPNTLPNFKNFLLQNNWANFNYTWHKASLSERD